MTIIYMLMNLIHTQEIYVGFYNVCLTYDITINVNLF